MKIISTPRRIPSPHVLCHNCYVVHGVSASELSHAQKFRVYFFTCPVCNEKVLVKASELPQEIRKELRKRKHH